jgi:hypothetical protein
MVSLVLLAIGCGEAAHAESIFTQSVPGLCSDAFGPPPVSQPVPLSQCTKDDQRNVIIGTGGCGPNVYVDQPFTGGNGFRNITINSGGQLAFLYHPGVELDLSAIVIIPAANSKPEIPPVR